MGNDVVRRTAKATLPSAQDHQANACAHCRRHGHTSGDCAVPNLKYGNIKPCPVCNTKSHGLDDCPAMREQFSGDQDFYHWLAEILLVKRYNKPQIRSKSWSFYNVLVAASENGFIEDLNVSVPGWPWSNEFAYKIGHAKPGDEILQGKLHPSQFDHALHDPSHLPEDPLFRGMTIKQVIGMYHDKNGKVKYDRDVPAYKMDWAKEPLTEEERESVLRAAMVECGPVGRNMVRSLVNANVSQDARVIKQESELDIETPAISGPTIPHWKNPAAQKAIRDQVFKFYR
ncbi:hypothetical protein B0I37DRAFT_377589 [Chaetomium sp. MPI-CAGE-AT-0009]|nr:hypothetical protein B0I37DRAFT_377589 [Chaetomium sp. MPI-CAGE-AT-0009]